MRLDDEQIKQIDIEAAKLSDKSFNDGLYAAIEKITQHATMRGRLDQDELINSLQKLKR